MELLHLLHFFFFFKLVVYTDFGLPLRLCSIPLFYFMPILQCFDYGVFIMKDSIIFSASFKSLFWLLDVFCCISIINFRINLLISSKKSFKVLIGIALDLQIIWGICDILTVVSPHFMKKALFIQVYNFSAVFYSFPGTSFSHVLLDLFNISEFSMLQMVFLKIFTF